MSKPISIQSRLLKSLLIGLPLLWGISTMTAGFRLWHEINEINDTQITQLSSYLIGISRQSNFSLNHVNEKQPQIADNSNTLSHNANLPKHQNPQTDNKLVRKHTDDSSAEHEPKIFQLEHSELSGDLGESEDDYMGFAIWSKQGTLLMADENGEHFPFLPTHQGFLEPNVLHQEVNPFSRQWRLFYTHDDSMERVIVVGQNLSSRREAIFSSLIVQLVPAIVGLALFLLLVVIAVRRGFSPLNQVSQTLQTRNLHDNQPLTIETPSEIQPLMNALNELFVKVADTLEREQRFTADASHELRSPLTALKLQADILEQEILQSQLNEVQEEKLFHHTQQIANGIERANHLVEQLLILAKLAPEKGLSTDKINTIDWITLSDNVLSQVNRQAREKHSQLKREVLSDPILPLTGNPTLLEILLRNLFDNAIRYCPQGSTITLALDKESVSVIDNGKGVSTEDLKRLSERFFRPVGQSERGSGLGLSIVERIAELHGLQINMENIIEHNTIKGFKVSLMKSHTMPLSIK